MADLDSTPRIFRINKEDYYPILILLFMTTVIFGPVLFYQRTHLDHIYHIQAALEMWKSKFIGEPHFLYHFIIIGIFLLIRPFWFKETLNQAGSLSENLSDPFILGLAASVLAEISLAIVLYFLILSSFENKISRNNRLWTIFLSLSLMLVSPINFIPYGDHRYYLGFIGVTSYHNPTQLLLKPIALILFALVVKILKDVPTQNTSNMALKVGALTVLSTLAKPNFIICLLPAFLFYSFYLFFKERTIAWRPGIFGILLPAILILGWQYFVNYGEGRFGDEKIIFAPFKVYKHYSPWLFSKFIFSIIFPATVYFGYFKKASKDVSLTFAWMIFLIGAFYTYFLAESGPQFGAGNFGWSGEISLFILFVYSILFFIRQAPFKNFKSKDISSKTFAFLTVITFSMHIMGGILWYYQNLYDLP